MMTGLDLAAGDYVMYTLATMAVAPNAVLLGGAYLLGPGFAVGTGTVVSPTVVSLGPVPAFPLLAGAAGRRTDARVDDRLHGGAGAWSPRSAAVLAQRAYRRPAYDSAALRGFGCGVRRRPAQHAAIALAGGPMGNGRMADIGAPVGEVLVSAVASMSLGGLVAGVGHGLVAASAISGPTAGRPRGRLRPAR